MLADKPIPLLRNRKMLSIPGIWVQAAMIGAVAFLVGWFRWWLALPLLLLPAVIALAALGSRYDESVARAIVEEHGDVYFAHSYASAGLAAVLVGVASWIGWRRKQLTQ